MPPARPERNAPLAGHDAPLAPRRVLVLGGARSGKSRYAQALAETLGGPLVFCATATDWGDAEMATRIAHHQADRDARWRTVEAPLALAEALRAAAAPGTTLLVDCLTLWLTNVMLGDHDVAGCTAALVATVAQLPGRLLLVSNEVGFGIVPDNALARRFRDAQGRLNQEMAGACEAVVLVVSGLPLVVKPGHGPALSLSPP